MRLAQTFRHLMKVQGRRAVTPVRQQQAADLAGTSDGAPVEVPWKSDQHSIIKPRAFQEGASNKHCVVRVFGLKNGLPRPPMRVL